MAKTSEEDNLYGIKANEDKDFHGWRQPATPESPKSPLDFVENATETIQQKSALCGVKDLSRISRKRRTLLSARSGRISSRKRNEDKDFGSNNEGKPRLTKKDPLPMRMRSLPQSFFQQPNSIKSSSLAQNTYSRLPPLFPQEHNSDEETTERPVTPTEERKQSMPKPPKRTVTSQPDTELLFKLFETVTPNHLEKKLVRRGRPKRVHSQKTERPNPNHEEDPWMADNVMGKLFPQLSLENNHKLRNARLASISVQNGNSCIELPTLAVDNNYPQVLREITLVL